MLPCVPWLRQGDVFEDVRWLTITRSDDDDTFVASSGPGAALLITHGCQMDKRTNAGRPKAKRLQFLPVHPITDLNHDSQERLRRHEVSPPEAVFVGALTDGREGFGLLGEAFTLPTSYFHPHVESFEGHSQADQSDPYHLVVTRHEERLGTIDDALVELMHSKMVAYWLGAQRA